MSISVDSAEVEKNKAFLRWFEAKGGSVHADVGLTSFPSMGRGAIALQDIKEGTVLFTLPRSLTLSMRTSSLPSKFGEREWKKYRLDKGWVGLILCMLWEDHAGEHGFWAGYLNLLPDQFQTPMFWNTDDLEELRGTSIYDKVGRAEAEKDYYDKLLPALNSRPDIFPAAAIDDYYCLQRYHIMGSRILSRSFHVERWRGEDEDSDQDQSLAAAVDKSDEMDIDTTDKDPTEDDGVEGGSESNDEDKEDPSDVAMVPLADILNARYQSENAKLCYDSEDLQMICTRDIQCGEQIWNTYGDPPNSDLLRRYGHVDLIPMGNGKQGNPADVVDIRADAVLDVLRSRSQNDDDSLLQRIEWWLEEGGDDLFTLETNFAIPEELISLIRLLAMPRVEWERTQEKGKVPRPKTDVGVLQIVETVLRKRLDEYKTTLEKDEALLETEKENTAKYKAIVVRVGERRILKGAIEEAMKGLTNENKNNKKRLIGSDEVVKSSKKFKRH
ncbi:hypothetical protein JB92DRAFT_2905584 [Gautieria morchelliformis]|nr:hypothetical protein JB92DRAFT_2905584 [Gautieria morchelliformis]